MKVLILSCNTGEGHNAAAYAMEERIKQEGHNATVLDVMLLKGKRTSKLVANTYINIAKNLPHFFGFIYQLGMLISTHTKKSPVYYANGRLAERLEAYLEEHHYDAIIVTHLYPAETITYMKQKGVSVPLTVAIATDYTCIPFWEETNCDYYIVPHREQIEEYVKRGINQEKLYSYGIPVSMKFLAHKNHIEVKDIKGDITAPKQYLIMSGSMGFGKVQLLTLQLLRKCEVEDRIVVICGNNQKLKRVLEKEFTSNKKIVIIGYTKEVADYMQDSDVIFTKPGGLTSTEAAVMQIPIIHTNPIPGCETKNRDFFEQMGMSKTSKKVTKQVEEGIWLANHPDATRKMQQAQRRNCNPRASLDIFNLIMKRKEQ